MKHEEMRHEFKEGHHRGRHGGKECSHSRGPKTFRRGRAVAFLEMLQLKRATIQQQLDEPVYESIKQVLVGELKAIDLVINEFIQVFEIHESEARELPNMEQRATESEEGEPKGEEPNEGN